MSEPASISANIAGRYATALFELAKESGALAALESDTDVLATALMDSADFRSLISSPVYSRQDQARATAALAAQMALGPVAAQGLALMAAKRRLFVLPQLVTALRAMIATEKGETTAEITAAQALSPEQAETLARTLSDRIGKSVKLDVAIDASLIGGLVVKVGSKMIDTSIRSKLSQLKNAMNEVG